MLNSSGSRTHDGEHSVTRKQRVSKDVLSFCRGILLQDRVNAHDNAACYVTLAPVFVQRNYSGQGLRIQLSVNNRAINGEVYFHRKVVIWQNKQH